MTDDFADRLREQLDAVAPEIAVDTSGVVRGARRRRRARAASAAVVALVAVSGVALAAVAAPWSPAPVPATLINGWPRPAWMDEEAVLRAQYDVVLQACFDAKGLDPVRGDEESIRGDDEESIRRNVEIPALLDCLEQVGGETIDWTSTGDGRRELYSREVDVWQCLGHLGFDLDAPPTEDEWLDQVSRAFNDGAGRWWRAYGQDNFPRITNSDLFLISGETHELCPAPWGLRWTPDDVDPDALSVDVSVGE